MKKTLVVLLTLLACAWCSAQQTGGDKIYKIGDAGPAGGIVFYDHGFTTGDGWRYLEAAPAEKEFKAIWGPKTNVAGTEARVGSGKRNTALIVAALGENGKAAYLCANLNFNGKNDWFLSSIDELGLLFNSLVWTGLGGFHRGGYWSSSQHDYDYAWNQRFSAGYQDGNYFISKNNTLSVRAVRAF
jgi:hypothetical protein